MKKIKLTKGKWAMVDDEDFDYLNQWKWWCDSSGYAVRDIGGRKNKKRILMHRLINKTVDKMYTDHINRNTLDNRKKNLRSVTNSENLLNSGLPKNNTSGHRGIDWYKNRWVARIKINYKGLYLGRFKTLKEAVNARKTAEKLYAI
jgi:hypothetical protein